MLTRRKIETLQNWGRIAAKEYIWTKADANLFLELEILKREINHKYYINHKHHIKQRT